MDSVRSESDDQALVVRIARGDRDARDELFLAVCKADNPSHLEIAEEAHFVQGAKRARQNPLL
jgi:hypothetical protein